MEILEQIAKQCSEGDVVGVRLDGSWRFITRGTKPATNKSFTFDILIKSYPPDFERLGYCLRSLEKFASGFRRVVVVIPKGEYVPVDHFLGVPHRLNVICIEVEETGDGYLFQQAVKANAHQYTDADFVLHIDSDTILTQPVTPETFMRDGKPLWLMTPYAHLQQGIEALSQANPGFHCGVMTWKPITEKFFGQAVEFEFMRRFPMLIPRRLHLAAAEFCRLKHGKSLAEYILSQPAKEFSEFNALGALAYYRAREDFNWLDTTKEPLPELVAIQKWSHEPFTDETKAEFEAILKGDYEPDGRLGDSDLDHLDRNQRSSDPNKRSSNDSVAARPNPNIRQTKEGIWVLANDTHISRWVEEHGTLFHDRQTLPKVLEEIQPGDTVIDVGANIGDTTAPFLERVGESGTVLAFEPNVDAWQCLKRNCPQAQCYPFALGAPGDPWLELAPDDNAGARHLRKFGFENNQGHAVHIATLDSLDLDRCDFIKIDVEGYELNVLRGAEQTINRFHPKMLLELNEGALQRQGTSQLEVTQWLAAHGYQWWPVQANLAPDSPQYDILCKWVGKERELTATFEELTATFDGLARVAVTPWQSPLESINEIRSLAGRLKKFCSSPAYTNKVRQELHTAGVIPVLKRGRKRKKVKA